MLDLLTFAAETGTIEEWVDSGSTPRSGGRAGSTGGSPPTRSVGTPCRGTTQLLKVFWARCTPS